MHPQSRPLPTTHWWRTRARLLARDRAHPLTGFLPLTRMVALYHHDLSTSLPFRNL